MKDIVSHEKKKKDYYKYSTFILGGLFIVALLGFGLISILKDSYNNGVVFGQENAVKLVIREVIEKGYIEINLGDNQSVVLVPNQLVQKGQQELVNGIFESLTEKGYVQLNIGDNNSVVLVPYKEP